MINYFYLHFFIFRGEGGSLPGLTGAVHLLLLPEDWKDGPVSTIFKSRLGGGIPVMGSHEEIGKLETSHGKKAGTQYTGG